MMQCKCKVHSVAHKASTSRDFRVYYSLNPFMTVMLP